MTMYLIVWTPKYRYRILKGKIKDKVEYCIRMFLSQNDYIIEELNVQYDHVHLLEMVPPKVSNSDLMGTLKGRASIRVFNKFKELKNRPNWGNHSWSKGYYVDTVVLVAEMNKKYVKYQENKDKMRRRIVLTTAETTGFYLL